MFNSLRLCILLDLRFCDVWIVNVCAFYFNFIIIINVQGITFRAKANVLLQGVCRLKVLELMLDYLKYIKYIWL